MSFDLFKIGGVPCRNDGTPQGCQFGVLCTFRHGGETKEQAQERQQAAYMAKNAAFMAKTAAVEVAGGGGGGGGGPASPPRVPRVQVAPWAPARATYAQKAQSNPEMPGWMIEGKKLENDFPEIEETYDAYRRAVETAIAAKKAADAAAQEAYKAAIAKAGGGKKKPHVSVGLTDQLVGSFADEAEDSEEE
jgi:hypothetical protein